MNISHLRTFKIKSNFIQSIIKIYMALNIHFILFDRVSQSVQSLSCVWLFTSLLDCSTPGLTVHHQLPEFTQTHVHWVSDAIQLFHSLLPPSLPALNLSPYQDLFQWVSSSHQVAKVLELQLQHHSFQRIFRVDFP